MVMRGKPKDQKWSKVMLFKISHSHITEIIKFTPFIDTFKLKINYASAYLYFFHFIHL